MATKPYKYQKDGIRQIHKFNGRALLADEMGLGKTLQALLFALQREDLRPVIVVCPATIKWNWEREAKVHIGMVAEVLSGQKPPKHPWRYEPNLIVINYDILPYWVNFLRDLNPRLIIVDEAQNIRNRKAKRTEAVTSLCRPYLQENGKLFRPKVVCMTGTAVTSETMNLFPILRILLPKIFRKKGAYNRFGERYSVKKARFRKPGRWDYKGARNTEELNKFLLRTCMIRRLKQDVLKDLPPKTRTVIPVEIKDYKQYEKASKDFMRWFKTFNPARAGRAERAKALSELEHMKTMAAVLKMPSFINWLNDFLEDTDEKLIIFGIHKKILKPLREKYRNISCFITGEVTGKARQVEIDKFNHDPKKRLMIGNLHAAGVGWSCFSASKTAHIELDWVPANHIQGEDRVHGVGRGMKNIPSQAFYFVAHGTIEEKICAINERKSNIAADILDGKKTNVDRMTIHDQLFKELEKK